VLLERTPMLRPFRLPPPSLACVAALVLGSLIAGSARPAAAQPQPFLVKDIAPNGIASNASWLTDVGGVLFFSAEDRVTGIDDVTSAELWRSDGTDAGTVQVADIYPGVQGSEPCELVAVGGTVFFVAWTPNGWGLWKSDGVSTSFVAAPAGLSWCENGLTAVGDTLFFPAGGKLWKTDGTTTSVVAEMIAGELTNVDGTLFFIGCDADHGCELWKSDGVTTALVADIRPGPDGSGPYGLVVIDGAVFFSADEPTAGREVWTSDGTTTSLFADINPGPAGSDAYVLGHIGGTIFFNADTPNAGRELWKSDGITTALVDINPGPEWSNPGWGTSAGDTLFFTAYRPDIGTELWKTDGTTTVLVADINPGPNGSEPGDLETLGNALFFRAYDATHGWEVHTSDGTTTRLVGDINRSTAWSYPLDLMTMGGTVFFSTSDGVHGRELWAFPASCGDHLPNTGEECDDGNLTSGDGCDASCQLESDVVAPTPTATPTPASTATPPCPARPIEGCRSANLKRQGFLKLVDKTPDALDTLEWKWRSQSAATPSDFGDPVSNGGTGYELCLYDGAAALILDAAIPAGGTCGTARRPKSCWRRTATGYQYRNGGATPDGIQHVKLDASRSGNETIVVSGKGTRLDDLPFPLAPPVTAQLHTSDGAVCWEATYGTPAAKTAAGRWHQFNGRPD
jgi:ELWxxDGT repeat protein/cysteine-rich repeat protein